MELLSADFLRYDNTTDEHWMLDVFPTLSLRDGYSELAKLPSAREGSFSEQGEQGVLARHKSSPVVGSVA